MKSVARGGADLLATTRGGTVDIAVKGTGPRRWIMLTERDRRADLLAWVDYSARLASGTARVELWVFDADGTLASLPSRPTLDAIRTRASTRFHERIGVTPTKTKKLSIDPGKNAPRPPRLAATTSSTMLTKSPTLRPPTTA